MIGVKEMKMQGLAEAQRKYDCREPDDQTEEEAREQEELQAEALRRMRD